MKKLPLRKNEFIWREIGGEVFILSDTGNKIITLNKVGALIWQLCDGKHNLVQIVDAVLEKFNVEKACAEHESKGFIDEMQKNGLITIT